MLLLNHAEMDCLRLAAWCKDLTQNTPQFIPADIFLGLIHAGFLRQSKCGLSWRPTQKCFQILNQAGFDYARDKYYLGYGDTYIRRLKLADTVLFLYSVGAGVFVETPTQIRYTENSPSQGFTTQQKLSFLPSFMFRRADSSNLLGHTQLTGFLYAPQTAFVTYYLSTDIDGLHPGNEQKTFSGEYLLCGRAPAVIYTGQTDLPGLIQTLNHAAEANLKNGAVTFKDAMEMFSCPVCFVPMSADGARQLSIMCQPDYRQRLVRALLAKDGHAKPDCLYFDAINKTSGEPFIVGIDMNLKGFKQALEYTGGKKLYIAVLEFQEKSVKSYLKNKNAALYPVSLDAVEDVLDLPGLPGPDFTPYQTKEGGYINVTTI